MKIIKKIIYGFLLLTTITYAKPGLQKLTVALDWFVNPDHAPLFVAQQQGYYRQEGLDVKFIPPADPASPAKWVAAGVVDVAVDYQPHYLLEVARGLPLSQVGLLIDRPLTCLVVLQSSHIHSIKELKGKTIGYSLGGISSVIVQRMLEYNGLSSNDVKWINVHYALSQALLSGKVDAASGMMRNFELLQLKLAGHPALAFYPEKNGVPPYAELILVTNKKNVNDPRIAKFLRAVARGARYLKQHPAQTWQQFATNHPELNNELNQQAWFATVPYFSLQPSKINRKECLRFATYLSQAMKLTVPSSAC